MSEFLHKLKAGRVVRVHSVNRVEVAVDLGFDVFVNRVFVLEDLRVNDIPADKRRQAVHCLVVLVGGKNVYVQPESMSGTAKMARLYLAEKVFGSPVGLVQHIPGLARPLLDVSTFMGWLGGCGFELREVKAVVNGTHGWQVEA